MSRVDMRLNGVEMNIINCTCLSWCEVCAALGSRTRAITSAGPIVVLQNLLFTCYRNLKDAIMRCAGRSKATKLTGHNATQHQLPKKIRSHRDTSFTLSRTSLAPYRYIHSKDALA